MWTQIAKKCFQGLLCAIFCPKCFENNRLHFFEKPLNRNAFTDEKLLRQQILRRVPRSGNIIGNSQKCQKSVIVWFVIITNSMLIKIGAWVFSTNSSIKNASTEGNHLIFILEKLVNASEIFRVEIAESCNWLGFSRKVKPALLQKFWPHFFHQGVNRLVSTGEQLLDSRVFLLNHCNGNLFGRNCGKKIKFSFTVKLFFFLQKLHFFIKFSINKFSLVKTFQLWYIAIHCFLQKFDRLKMAKFLCANGSSWGSHSFVSKTVDRTSSPRSQGTSFSMNKIIR